MRNPNAGRHRATKTATKTVVCHNCSGTNDVKDNDGFATCAVCRGEVCFNCDRPLMYSDATGHQHTDGSPSCSL